ncbi:OPT oligopeptide transporter [Clavulina sp. PMI_390]|nr:OPT oligopeptide transporter [Clavulina sp. PMI_390]
MSVEPKGSSSGSLSDKFDIEAGAPRVQEVDVDQNGDPNLDAANLDGLDEDSPYPEVRSAVANTDDPDMPCSTGRVWILGMIMAMIIPGLNQFFFFRYPSVTVGNLVGQLISYPLGRGLAKILPDVELWGMKLSPGPFTVKEHVLVTIMATVGYSSAYATDIVAVQRVFYNQRWNFSYQWFMVMSTQLIGFSIGGIARRFLVTPPSMIWPANLVYCALFNTLHSQQYAGIGERRGVSRERFFVYVLTGGAIYYLLPGYLFSALSLFNWVCWIAPTNSTVNTLFGYSSGLGMSLLTFDWSQIAYNGSPLATPWWAQANVLVGFVVFFWIIAPAMYFSNVWYAQYLPILSSHAFDNTGSYYNVTRILTDHNTLDHSLYEQYSPLFLPTVFAISYGLSFASVTATLSHAFLYFRKQIWTQSRRSMSEMPDIHARLMSKYQEVPDWWYAVIFLTMFAFAIISIQCWPSELPVWALIIALLIAFIYIIPIGMIQAITNQQVGLNVITELIVGYMLPGRPIAMMMFKTWGYIAMAQGLTLSSDFKLGHYMKIPPRPMFWAQIVASIVALTTQLGVQAWMFSNINGMCDNNQDNGFICLSTTVFGTASIIWGVIGPANMFGPGKLYHPLVYFFLIGAVAPVIPWLLTKKYPNSFVKYVNMPVVFTGTGNIPPATAENYIPAAIVCFIFNYLIRRRHFSWWAKYNYVLSAALDSGVAVSSVLIFFILQYPKKGTIGATTVQTWWGNTVYANTNDGMRVPKLTPDATLGYFGPAPSTF